MNITAPLLASYTNGGVHVRIHEDGTKVRTVLNDIPPVLPEQMDVKITNYCDAGCAWCHESSTTEGRHADLSATLQLLAPLPAGAEIAIGGGDPLSHPELKWFLERLAEQGIIASITVNGKHIERHRETLNSFIAQKLIYGLGISYHVSMPVFEYEHKVVHFIAGVHDPKILLEDNISPCKILILGYKSHGRGTDLFKIRSEKVNDNLKQWKALLPFIAEKFHLCMDNLAVAQLEPQRLFSSKEDFDLRYMGEEGKYSMYLDAVEQQYTLSSYTAERFAWTKLSGMFRNIQKQYVAS